MLDVIFTEDSFRMDVAGRELTEQEDALVRKMSKAKYEALFEMGFAERDKKASPTMYFLQSLAREFVKALTASPDLEVARDHLRIELDEDEYERILAMVPFGIGVEYVGKAWISLQFMRLTDVYNAKIRDYDGTVALFLTERSQNLRVPERIFFHLVDNDDDDEYPFAFLATYATLDEEERVKHMPLSYALVEFDGERQKLVALLSCMSRVAEISPLLGGFIDSGEIFHPLRMTAGEAFQFLCDIPAIEEAGVVCRVPNWWKNHSSTVNMQISLGEDQPPMLGMESIVSMKPELAVDGVPLTEEEVRDLLLQTEGLARLKGKWVEVDHARLEALLEAMAGYQGELSLLEALKMQAGLSDAAKEQEESGVEVTNGQWLSHFLKDLRRPDTIHRADVPDTVDATLRGYQQTGYEWLNYLTDLGFGACLADDMGLGKTLQTLAFLAALYQEKPDAQVLLVVPASLLGNWQKEAARFVPEMPVRILHGMRAPDLEDVFFGQQVFLNITTYGMALRMERLSEVIFDCLILDEAQAIKNARTKQTRAIKKLRAARKIALTGTPIENDLSNLWSLFDFLNKGLLGTAEEFRNYTSHIADHPEGYQRLKTMISPFILRRLKTDKRIISDLPDKVEKTEYVSLSAKQAVLYRKQVEALERAIVDADGMQRRGLVLATITKLKQICNHPDQYMGQDRFAPKDSGKFEVLRTLCETIYDRRERVLVFTQYKEIIPALESYLAEVFHCKGLVIHGGVPTARRQKLVERFNGEEYVPFMILSLKAGGTGLNLTAANHVIHFDRWWNPAVENQATDRAYRIGQDKKVIVHKFVVSGTIEEKINAMIEKKKDLAEKVIGGSSGGENWITEMSDDEIINLMRLER